MVSLNLGKISGVSFIWRNLSQAGTEKKLIKYISNGVELKTNFNEHYFDILDMEKGKLFDRGMILIQVKKQHFYYQEDVAVGYKTRFNTVDIELAEDYILNNFDYVVHMN